MHRRVTENQGRLGLEQRIDASALLLLDFLEQSELDDFFASKDLKPAPFWC